MRFAPLEPTAQVRESRGVSPPRFMDWRAPRKEPWDVSLLSVMKDESRPSAQDRRASCDARSKYDGDPGAPFGRGPPEWRRSMDGTRPSELLDPPKEKRPLFVSGSTAETSAMGRSPMSPFDEPRDPSRWNLPRSARLKVTSPGGVNDDPMALKGGGSAACFGGFGGFRRRAAGLACARCGGGGGGALGLQTFFLPGRLGIFALALLAKVAQKRPLLGRTSLRTGCAGPGMKCGSLLTARHSALYVAFMGCGAPSLICGASCSPSSRGIWKAESVAADGRNVEGGCARFCLGGMALASTGSVRASRSGSAGPGRASAGEGPPQL